MIGAIRCCTLQQAATLVSPLCGSWKLKHGKGVISDLEELLTFVVSSLSLRSLGQYASLDERLRKNASAYRRSTWKLDGL